MSLRLRITLTTAILVLLSATVLAIFAYSTASRIQYDTLDQGLLGASGQVRTKAVGKNPNPLPPDVYQPYAIALITPGSDSAEVLLPAGYGDRPLPFPAITRAQAEAGRDEFTTVSGNPDYRVLIRYSGPQNALLIVGAATDQIAAGLESFALWLGIAVAGITALGALLSWLVVRRFFRPVDDMIDAAAAIAEGELGRRVPQAPAGTELGALSDSLNAMIEELTGALDVRSASEARLRAFVSDASHEIRTPLTVIRGYVDLLQAQRREPDDLEQRALDRISSESIRLESLVTQLLLLERIDAAPDERTDLDLEPLVREYLGDLAELGSPRPIEWATEPTVIHGNADQWRQLLANITQNLQRHTPGGSAVRVLLHADRGVAELVIDDAGPGIPADQRAIALERFGRPDSSRARSTGGFGLGMSVIAAVVARHEGTLDLLDSPAGGLRLRITVPAA